MIRPSFILLCIAFALYSGNGAEPETGWRAGVAKANITPDGPLWLAGYADRTNTSNGKIMDLWVKALALEDANKRQVVFLTSDTLGIPGTISDVVTSALKDKFGLARDQVVLSASHTHCGPVLRGALMDMYPLNYEQLAAIDKYTVGFEEKIIDTIGKAIADLSPVRVRARQGTTAFAVNRRNNPEAKVPRLIIDGALKGPVDHAVPVLCVARPDGTPKAILFGYACHNTVMSFYKWSGDYAGFAQLALERSHSNCTAMFFMGCGGDQNPLPRRTLVLAERYGNMLAAAVEEVLTAPPHWLPAQIKTASEMVTLNLGPTPTQSELEALTHDPAHSARHWANRLLGELKAGKSLIRAYPFPIQAWRLGGSQLLITLGGEPVVDYALKFKHEFGPDTWVAGYCNDVMTYIPSLRVLKEGGYEGGRAMIPYGMPALRWADDVEDLITAATQRVVKRLE
jgi:neutral ceramidase